MSKLKEVLTYRVSEVELPKYKAGELPKFVVGAAIIGGGIYGIVRLMLNKKEKDEMALLTELHKEKLATANPMSSVRGDYAKGRGHYGRWK